MYYIDVKAKEENCSMIVLDALQEITAHRFITIKGMAQRLSFCKIINEEGLS
jgi:hypothetical protein